MSFRAAGALVGEVGLGRPRDVLGLWEPWWRIGGAAVEDNWATGAIRRLEGARGGGVLYTVDLLGGWSALREGGTWG